MVCPARRTFNWLGNWRTPSAEKAQFRQSSFWGTAVSLVELQKRRPGHRPTLVEAGEIDRFILGQMDGASTLEAIARRTARRFPERFGRWEDALGHASELSVKYSR